MIPLVPHDRCPHSLRVIPHRHAVASTPSAALLALGSVSIHFSPMHDANGVPLLAGVIEETIPTKEIADITYITATQGNTQPTDNDDSTSDVHPAGSKLSVP